MAEIVKVLSAINLSSKHSSAVCNIIINASRDLRLICI